MGILDWFKRRPRIVGVEAVKEFKLPPLDAFPIPSNAVKRVCRWCSRPWPIAEVSAIGLCPYCQKAHDRREEYTASLRGGRK